MIIFEAQYYSPDGKVGFWKREDFNYPLFDYDTSDGADDTRSLRSVSSFTKSSALEETAFLRPLDLSQ